MPELAPKFLHPQITSKDGTSLDLIVAPATERQNKHLGALGKGIPSAYFRSSFLGLFTRILTGAKLDCVLHTDPLKEWLDGKDEGAK